MHNPKSIFPCNIIILDLSFCASDACEIISRVARVWVLEELAIITVGPQ